MFPSPSATCLKSIRRDFQFCFTLRRRNCSEFPSWSLVFFSAALSMLIVVPSSVWLLRITRWMKE